MVDIGRRLQQLTVKTGRIKVSTDNERNRGHGLHGNICATRHCCIAQVLNLYLFQNIQGRNYWNIQPRWYSVKRSSGLCFCALARRALDNWISVTGNRRGSLGVILNNGGKA